MEDGVFTAKVLAKLIDNSFSVTRLQRALYHYRIRQGSLVHKHQTREEKCGYFSNAFERLEILAGVVANEDIIRKMLKEYQDALYGAVDSSLDLNIQNVFLHVRTTAAALLSIVNASSKEKKLLMLCVETKNQKQLTKNVDTYRKEQLIGSTTKVKLKFLLKLCKRGLRKHFVQ